MPAESAVTAARVMLVDDHAIVRRGLRSILELEPDISVVAEAGGRSEALRLLDRVQPDVILLDLKLSADHDAEGLELCSEILARRPGSRVVILSTFLDENLLNQSLHRGAKAYVLKEVDVVELVRIIRAVSHGESGFDSRSAEMMRSLVVQGGRRPGLRAHLARARGHRVARTRPHQPRDRHADVREREHRQVPRPQRHAQARGAAAGGGRLRRGQAGPARRLSRN